MPLGARFHRGHSLRSDLLRMFRQKILTDTQIRIQTRSGKTVIVEAHRIVLASRSSVLEDLLFRHEDVGQITLPIVTDQISVRCLTFLIEFLYSDKLKYSFIEDFIEISLAAKHFKISGVTGCCKRLLRKFQVNSENVLALLEASKFFELQVLHLNCLEVLQEASKELIDNNKFIHEKADDAFQNSKSHPWTIKIATSCVDMKTACAFFGLNSFETCESYELKLSGQIFPDTVIYLSKLQLAFGTDFVPESCIDLKLSFFDTEMNFSLDKSPDHYYIKMDGLNEAPLQKDFPFVFSLALKVSELRRWGANSRPISDEKFRVAHVSPNRMMELCPLSRTSIMRLMPLKEYLVFVDPQRQVKNPLITNFYFNI